MNHDPIFRANRLRGIALRLERGEGALSVADIAIAGDITWTAAAAWQSVVAQATAETIGRLRELADRFEGRGE